jgi:hypothetical protein
MVLGLVRFRTKSPDFAPSVYVTRPYDANFAWTATGKPLETDHVGHDPGHVLQRPLDDGIVNRQDRR